MELVVKETLGRLPLLSLFPHFRALCVQNSPCSPSPHFYLPLITLPSRLQQLLSDSFHLILFPLDLVFFL
jgi:hypothetical protein